MLFDTLNIALFFFVPSLSIKPIGIVSILLKTQIPMFGPADHVQSNNHRQGLGKGCAYRDTLLQCHKLISRNWAQQA